MKTKAMSGGSAASGGGDGVLAFFAALYEGARSGCEGQEGQHLALVAVDDDVEVGDAAGGERGGGVREDRAGERSEDLVGDGAGHAGLLPAARRMAAVRGMAGSVVILRKRLERSSTLGAELREDGAGGGDGVWGFENRAANHDMAGAGAGGLAGRHDAGLVANIGTAGADAGCDQGDVGREDGAERG